MSTAGESSFCNVHNWAFWRLNNSGSVCKAVTYAQNLGCSATFLWWPFRPKAWCWADTEIWTSAMPRSQSWRSWISSNHRQLDGLTSRCRSEARWWRIRKAICSWLTTTTFTMSGLNFPDPNRFAKLGPPSVNATQGRGSPQWSASSSTGKNLCSFTLSFLPGHGRH